MLSHQSYNIFSPPILTFPHKGGRDLYLPLSAFPPGEGISWILRRNTVTHAHLAGYA
jgi:hypothetical protein